MPEKTDPYAPLRLALYEPDIPQNTAAVLRTAACLAVPVDVIEPCGFVWGGKHMKRSGMDYLDQAAVMRHVDWAAFQDAHESARRVLLTTRVDRAYCDFTFEPGDILLFGRESAGVPETVHAAADVRLTIPMAPGARSLNLAASVAMVLGEALRQLDGFSKG